MLPIAMVAGAVAYLVYASMPCLDPVRPYVNLVYTAVAHLYDAVPVVLPCQDFRFASMPVAGMAVAYSGISICASGGGDIAYSEKC